VLVSSAVTPTIAGAMYSVMADCGVGESTRIGRKPFSTSPCSQDRTVSDRTYDRWRLLPCGVPAGIAALALYVYEVDPTNLGFIKLWPASRAEPDVSTVNYQDGRR
jgi:hypothetical protein